MLATGEFDLASYLDSLVKLTVPEGPGHISKVLAGPSSRILNPPYNPPTTPLQPTAATCRSSGPVKPHLRGSFLSGKG